MWFVTDPAMLASWKARLSCQTGMFQFVEVLATGNAHACDACLLLGDCESLTETESKARAYWRGDMQGETSQPEILFEGSLKVIRILEFNP